jgi:hypothetical protein
VLSEVYMRFSWLLLSICCLGACTYISPEFEEELLGDLDEDGDGCTKKGAIPDCDDDNPHVCQLFVEIPYDGYDNDCSSNLGLLDEVDIDGDQVPGIDYDEWIANGADPGAWPSEVEKTSGLVDCRDVTPDEVENYVWKNFDGEEYTPASHEDAVNINPKVTNDLDYDGIDSNCNEDNDFDNDLDGYVPPEFDVITAEGPNKGVTYGVAFEAYIEEWGYFDLVVQYGDCEGDADININPGVDPADDEWYDGHDQDCAGNNDFDQDGDNFTPEVDGAGNNKLKDDYQVFLDNYYGGTAPTEWGDVNAGGLHDCNDLEATVFPGATDDWYDGIDSDCGQDNDYDQDADGIIDELPNTDWCNSPADYVDYFNSWSFQGGTATQTPGLDSVELLYGKSPSFNGADFTCDPSTPLNDFDCEPTRADFYPGATEVLGDTFDGDCDGAMNRTPMFGDPGTVDTWTGPGDVVLGKNDEHYLLSTTANAVLYDGLVQEENNVGVTLYFEHDVGFGATVEGTLTRRTSRCDSAISEGLDVATTSDGFFLINGCKDASKAWLIIEKYSWAGSSYSPGPDPNPWEIKGSTVASTYSSFDIELNAAGDTWYAWAAGPPGLTFATGDLTTSAKVEDDSTNTQELGFMDLDQELGLTCDGSSCSAFDLDLTTPTFSSSSDVSWLSFSPVDVSHHHNAIVIANDGPSGVDIVASGGFDSAFSGDAVTATDALYVGNNLYVAAAIGDDVWIAWGDSSGNLETANLGNGSFPDFELDAPNDVAIFADSGKVVVAASNDTEVMWAFFDLPP